MPTSTLPLEADPRWQLLRERRVDPAMPFVYGVKTTGVYCSADSPTRLPRAENVEFFDTPAAAEAAGYRRSKRAIVAEVAGRHQAAVARACRCIEQAEQAPALETLARQAGISPSHFHRMFKAATGLTPKRYADAYRANKLRDRLHAGVAGTDTVTAALYDAGFNASSRFYAASAKLLGMPPRKYRAGGQNAKIRFAIGQCTLGAILVAQSEHGVCAILIGDDPDMLARDLQDRFPHAELLGGEAGFERLVAQVVGFVEAPRLGLALPLDVRGTAFQQRVWQALAAIPPGATASYTEIAARIGSPAAVRAVAGACAANALAVAIPCHRVVRSDGGLSGYRWGVERKRLLLMREADQCAMDSDAETGVPHSNKK